MISNASRDTIDAIADKFYEGCLRASVADSLGPEWRKQLTERLRSLPNGAAISAICVQYGKTAGWFTLFRLGSVIRADFWAPELRLSGNPARKAIDTIQVSLGSVLTADRMVVRGKPPYDFLTEKGWAAAEIKQLKP